MRVPRFLNTISYSLLTALCVLTAGSQLIRMVRAVAHGPQEWVEVVPAFGQADVVYFGEPTCPACKAASPAVTDLQRRYPRYRLARVDVSTRAGDALQEQYYRAYKVPTRDRDRIPIAFAGHRYFLGSVAITEDLRHYLGAGPLPSPLTSSGH
jgi:hypothetical protein